MELENSLKSLLDSIKKLDITVKMIEKYPNTYREKLVEYDIELNILKNLNNAKIYQLEILKKGKRNLSLLRELLGDKKINNIIDNAIRNKKLNNIR